MYIIYIFKIFDQDMSESPSRESNFYAKSQEEKKASLKVLDNYLSGAGYQKWWSEIKKSKIQKEFKDKQVDYDSLNQAMQWITTVWEFWEKLNLNEVVFGNIKFENKKEVCDDVRKMWPFQTHKILATKVSEYIKSNMKFPYVNYYNWWNVWEELQKEWLLNWSATNYDLVVDNMKVKLSSKWIKFSTEDLKSLKDKMQIDWSNNNGNWLIDILDIFWSSRRYSQLGINIQSLQSSLPEIKKEATKLKEKYWSSSRYNSVIQDFITCITTKNSQKIKTNLYDYMDVFYKIWRGDLIRAAWNMDWFDVLDYIKNGKIWVCRHFASIAKMIFEEMKWEVLEKGIIAEVNYAWNLPNAHAYNQLKTEDQNWNIKEEYFDITSFMQWKTLRKEVWNWEMYGQKNNEVIANKINKSWSQDQIW